MLRDGSEVRMRPAGRTDAPLVAALHARCSPDVRRARFLSPTPQLAQADLAALVGAAPWTGHAVLAVTADGGSAVGLANLDPEGPSSARFAVPVENA